jgi:hypothetical protein
MDMAKGIDQAGSSGDEKISEKAKVRSQKAKVRRLKFLEKRNNKTPEAMASGVFLYCRKIIDH